MKLARMENALDMLDHALVIVDEAGAVHYRNRPASALLKSAGSPLTLAAGMLGGRGRELHAALQAAIRLACVERRSSALASQGTRAPLRLLVVPMDSAGGSREAAVWILAPHSPRLPHPRVLAVLFGLSRAEARLALRLLAGLTPQECAREAGVGVATVRSQLHSMFAKTGARRQAELVALLARVPVLGAETIRGRSPN
ncbi:MAG TPA: helix-turn-helix transcriptional regulator [Burkholderiales bacterium]|nr:helix-turn-helix transcriptional regulator [Burkholderiales bacterium]